MVLSKFRKVSQTLFSKYLLLTNTFTNCTLLVIGDGIIQRIERIEGPEKKHDIQRSGRMFCMGLLFGPVTHYWYKVLDKHVPGAILSSVVKKIAADQAVAAPFFCSAFFMGMSLLEGKPVSAGVEEVKSKFLTVYMVDWCVWPPAQFINFFFLPPRFRVVYVSFITLLWNTFLSWMKHAKHIDVEDEVK